MPFIKIENNAVWINYSEFVNAYRRASSLMQYNYSIISNNNFKDKTKKKGLIMSSKSQDLKNKFKIFQLVKKHFSLDKKSLKLFKYRLFNEPLIAPEYAELLKDSKDLRLRINLSDDEMYIMDNGWKTFKKVFCRLIDHCSLKYKDFRENLVTYNGQKYKLKKAIVDFYSKNLKYFIEAFSMTSELRNEICKKYGKKIINDYSSFYFRGSNSEVMEFSRSYEDRFIIRFDEIKPTKKIIEIVEETIIYSLEDIGSKKMPTKKLQLVLSLNFADWFLCSTGESWSSCLSLDSSYHEAFWTGLPSLIGDKNRAMVYLTDGGKKTKYGITVDKVIGRSFILTVKQKQKDKKYKYFFSLIKEYPQHFGFENLLKEYLKMNFIPIGESSFNGKYYIELFKHDVGRKRKYISCIFQDNVKVKIASKNKAKHFPVKYGYYQSGFRGHTSIFLNDENNSIEETTNKGWDYTGGISFLIEEKESLKKYFSFSR